MPIGTIPKNLTMKFYQLLLYFTLVSSSEGKSNNIFFSYRAEPKIFCEPTYI